MAKYVNNVDVNTDNGISVITGDTNTSSYENKSGNETTTFNYNDPITLEKFLGDRGLKDEKVLSPSEIEDNIQKYLTYYKNYSAKPENPQDEIDKLNRQKKWNVLGNLIGGTVGLMSDTASASQGGVVSQRNDKINTDKEDAKIAALNTDYKNRLAAYNKNLDDQMNTIRTRLIYNNKYATEINKMNRTMFNDFLKQKKSEDKTSGSTTSKTGSNGVLTAMNNGSGAGAGSGQFHKNEKFSNIRIKGADDGKDRWLKYPTTYNDQTSTIKGILDEGAKRTSATFEITDKNGQVKKVNGVALLNYVTDQLKNASDDVVKNRIIEDYLNVLMENDVNARDYIVNELSRLPELNRDFSWSNEDPTIQTKEEIATPVQQQEQEQEQIQTGQSAADAVANSFD